MGDSVKNNIHQNELNIKYPKVSFEFDYNTARKHFIQFTTVKPNKICKHVVCVVLKKKIKCLNVVLNTFFITMMKALQREFVKSRQSMRHPIIQSQ